MYGKFFLKGFSSKYLFVHIAAWLLYGICCITLLWSYKYSDLGAIETLWDAGTSVIVPIIGYLIFNDKINITSGSGIILTCVGIYLIGLGAK